VVTPEEGRSLAERLGCSYAEWKDWKYRWGMDLQDRQIFSEFEANFWEFYQYELDVRAMYGHARHRGYPQAGDGGEAGSVAAAANAASAGKGDRRRLVKRVRHSFMGYQPLRHQNK
jgi:hypothetical protein